jgi:hypothetical protein
MYYTDTAQDTKVYATNRGARTARHGDIEVGYDDEF